MKKYFTVNVSRYVPDKNFEIYRPASLNLPKDNALMFISSGYEDKVTMLRDCRNCLVFCPENMSVPNDVIEHHAVCFCKDPRIAYCTFFKENRITYLPVAEEYEMINGSYIAGTASIGKDCVILPSAYIGGEVEIGDHCYIGSGVRLMGEIHIGNHVVIRENSVLGADGLSTDRDANGAALTMPQFGGIVIEDDVQIGALTVIGRGAIDNTVIRRGSKIDNCSFISHNVQIGEDTFIVGESIMFGSSSTGNQAFISGNATIRNGIHIGEHAIVGMGSVVVKDVPDGAVVKGNPAR